MDAIAKSSSTTGAAELQGAPEEADRTRGSVGVNRMTASAETFQHSRQFVTLQLMLSHRLLVGTIVLLFTAAAATAAYLTTPVYRATVVVFPAESRTSMVSLESALGGIGGLGSLVGIGAGETKDTVEAVALLQSRDFAEAFIRDHDLMRRLFANRGWRASMWSRSEPTLYDAYRIFDRKIRHISEDRKTGLVTLQVDWTNADEGARWANEMIQLINALMRQRALSEADASIDLLTSELKAAPTVELRDAIARAIETSVKTRTLAKVRLDYAFRVIDSGKPAGPRDFIRPQRALYLSSGFIVGLVFAFLTVYTRQFLIPQMRDPVRP
jgi:LPS O-antigen subunit length determinant protein (WzzB/FepE family)